MQKNRLFYWFVLEVWLIKNPAIWLAEMWPIPLEQNFSHTWDLCRKTANNLNCYYRTNSVKINEQIFKKFWKLVFSPFSQIWGQKFFSGKSGTVTHNLICQHNYKFRKKTNDTIPWKHLDRWKDRQNARMDRAYFIQPFWLLLRVHQEFETCLAVSGFTSILVDFRHKIHVQRCKYFGIKFP